MVYELVGEGNEVINFLRVYILGMKRMGLERVTYVQGELVLGCNVVISNTLMSTTIFHSSVSFRNAIFISPSAFQFRSLFTSSERLAINSCPSADFALHRPHQLPLRHDRLGFIASGNPLNCSTVSGTEIFLADPRSKTGWHFGQIGCVPVSFRAEFRNPHLYFTTLPYCHEAERKKTELR